MPITQQRLLAVLASAEDFREALSQASAIARRERDLAIAGRQTEGQALANIAMFLDNPLLLLASPSESGQAIAIERAHFSPSKVRDNAREARRIARLRARRSGQPSNQERGER